MALVRSIGTFFSRTWAQVRRKKRTQKILVEKEINLLEKPAELKFDNAGCPTLETCILAGKNPEFIDRVAVEMATRLKRQNLPSHDVVEIMISILRKGEYQTPGQMDHAKKALENLVRIRDSPKR